MYFSLDSYHMLLSIYNMIGEYSIIDDSIIIYVAGSNYIISVVHSLVRIPISTVPFST